MTTHPLGTITPESAKTYTTQSLENYRLYAVREVEDYRRLIANPGNLAAWFAEHRLAGYESDLTVIAWEFERRRSL